MEAERLSLTPQGTIPTFPDQNKAAERLRRLEIYKRADTVMVPPDQAQLQVRINAVMDGKRLIMASPGLRDGFYLLHKSEIKARDWKDAARSSGVRRFGKKLATTHFEIGTVDLMATGAVAVGLKGGRIGKGSGYFDLEYMILREIGSVDEITPICALVDDCQVLKEVPMEAKDVAVDLICTPTRIITTERPLSRPTKIPWGLLNEKYIKGMRPLRELSRNNEEKD
ncbi:MAG: 5-formyltetrahydrofolate cyclo-ligase [Deltaproteobacteria bacterium]|nr:5-formyltetrahydrofolate cyclo-ligase [Deltaproteobacteria bacterium]